MTPGDRTSLRSGEAEEEVVGTTAAGPRVRRGNLRDHMPALETERQVNDWGRSERVEGLFDKTIGDFFYNYWFRAEVEGIENVPQSGGALLVSNHSGALPPDAAMIAKAIKEEHPQPRPLNITVEHFFKGYPGFSMLMPKIGCVAAHRIDGSLVGGVGIHFDGGHEERRIHAAIAAPVVSQALATRSAA